MVASEVEPVHLNLIDQRRARNAELQGGPGAVAAMELEGLLDVHPLHVRECLRLVALIPTPLAQVRRNVLVSSTFRSLGCSSGARSPISSRKMVPRSASSNSPWRRSFASVKAPFSCPNSSDSRNVAERPPQLTSTNGPLARGER